jgi:hypothetical protein
MLLRAPHPGERQLQVLVHPRAGVLEPVGLRLDAVHEDDADAGKRVVVELADRGAHHVPPGEHLFVEGHPPLFEQIQTHRLPS